MQQWARVATLEECVPGTSREVVVGDLVIGLFNVEGELFALDGICPHQGGPLAQGQLRDGLVTCPWHGWQFDVRTGQHSVNSSLCHTSYSVKVEDGDVYVLVDTND
jgi:nitrite reductase (NADH) small subunit